MALNPALAGLDLTSANARLLDRAIRHAMFVQKYGAQMGIEASVDLDTFLAKVFSRVVKTMEGVETRGVAVSSATRASIRDSLRQLAVGSDRTFESLRKGIYNKLRSFGELEAKWQASIFTKVVPTEAGLVFNSPRLSVVSDILERRPLLVQGRSTFAREVFSGMSNKLQLEVRGVVDSAMRSGASIRDITQRLKGFQGKAGVFGQTRANLRAAARTLVNHVSNQAREEVYAANKDLIKGIKWVSVLDTLTSPICQSLDGTVFPPEEGERPPAHFNCRSTTVPILKSWRQYGIKDPPPSVRQALDGKVPGDLTYEQWLRTQPAWIQDKALGPKRAALFRDGKIASLKDLIDASGKPIRLDELFKIEGLNY